MAGAEHRYHDRASERAGTDEAEKESEAVRPILEHLGDKPGSMKT